MPTISSFFGIVISMYWERGAQHHHSHIHARYQEHHASYSIAPAERIAGAMPKRQERLILAWIEIHEADLLANWQLLSNGEHPNKIPPLQ